MLDTRDLEVTVGPERAYWLEKEFEDRQYFSAWLEEPIMFHISGSIPADFSSTLFSALFS